MANFRTEGRITTQSALSRTSWGMLSGASRISLKTLPAFSTRDSSLSSFSSFSWATAVSASSETNGKHSQIFFTNPPEDLGHFKQSSSNETPKTRDELALDRPQHVGFLIHT